MTNLNYDEAAVAREEANYQTGTARARRAFVHEQLNLKSGESVLSIGCGPGFEPSELASQTNASRVLGVDSNPTMLAVSRDRCPDAVSLLRGDATSIPVADGSVETAVSVQVYEYIDDIDAALSELHRVLDSDGRAVIYATDWESLVWRVRNSARSNRVLSAWNEHCSHPHLGSTLEPKLRAASFDVTDIVPYTLLLTELGQDSFAYYLLASIREFVTPRLGAEVARQWAEDVRTRDRRSESFFSLTQFCYLVEPVDE
ncbi:MULTISPECIES: methyltransferase domain-containing protein [Haloferax]|uniref:Malonyl-[acyl-carrier protein] O-methyltransferase n=1 Tax=Haloferax massiliensis TaxID=1476858 RepID=A0A0D6JVI5_9EURY|nr:MULTISPECIES: methyltransferase domain-containing protein [Haloferax]MDS0242197.1 methyltransferase domain-containing protein [Haloferax sp. S2CR25]MDS0445318.1 methyltransferase domain-containing protein [Haloferax sp. S2CR25-2]CQR52936.1 Malonyl-[acyl-carrier protein] O-methyltransferase [Haloferax massiliensis]